MVVTGTTKRNLIKIQWKLTIAMLFTIHRQLGFLKIWNFRLNSIHQNLLLCGREFISTLWQVYDLPWISSISLYGCDQPRSILIWLDTIFTGGGGPISTKIYQSWLYCHVILGEVGPPLIMMIYISSRTRLSQRFWIWSQKFIPPRDIIYSHHVCVF